MMSSNSMPSMFTKALIFIHILFIMQSGIVACSIPLTKISSQKYCPFNLARTESFINDNNSSEFHWDLVVGTFSRVTSAEMGC